MRVAFVKFSGAGNDLLFVDHRDGSLRGREPELARVGCDRRFGVGADGLLLLEDDLHADFRVRFFNPDGGEYALCGNGARCVPRFATELGLPGPRFEFVSDSGRHVAEMVDAVTGRIELPGVREVRRDIPAVLEGRAVTLDWGDIGVPHAAFRVDDVDAVPIERWGPELRHASAFDPDGTNISFVQEIAPGHVRIRTFERGVEGETWACGSGSAVVATLFRGPGEGPETVQVDVRGGRLALTVPPVTGPPIVLEGPVHRCCEGILDLPAPAAS